MTPLDVNLLRVNQEIYSLRLLNPSRMHEEIEDSHGFGRIDLYEQKTQELVP